MPLEITYKMNKVRPCTLLPHYSRSFTKSPLWKSMFVAPKPQALSRAPAGRRKQTLILVLLAAAAARRHSRSVPAQRSKDRHAPTPHLQRASSLLYPNLQWKLLNSTRNVLLFTSSHTCPQHATSSALVANRGKNPCPKCWSNLVLNVEK